MAMAGWLAAEPEASTEVSTAAYPPRSLYRDLIRRVAVSGAQIRSTPFSQYGHSGSSYSSASNSCPSNSSGCSSGSASSAAADFVGAHKLREIAQRMVSDGYTQSMIQAFDGVASPALDQALDLESWLSEIKMFDIASPTPTIEYGDGPDRVLETWFLELDVAWVLQIRHEHGSRWQLRLQDKSASSLQNLVERWIRGLTVMVHSVIELVSTRNEITEVVRFGKASIYKMLVFVDAIVNAFKAENLRAALDMYICVCMAICNMDMFMCWDNKGIAFLSLFRSANCLSEAISSTMLKVRTLIEDDDSWAIDIPRGGGEVHRNTRWIVDCIVSLGEAEVSSISMPNNNARSLSRMINDTVGYRKYYMDYMVSFGEVDADSNFIPANNIIGVIDDAVGYLKDLLLRKSEFCSDPSLRYLFLLNNSYFLAQMFEPSATRNDWKLTPECEKYMYSYFDASWGHVLSCIPKSHFPGQIHRWISTSSLVKFESAFHQTHQAQKFWKVPDPRLRDVLRGAITQRVISGYRDYLEEHPELQTHVGRESSSPDVLKEMLGELFEG